MSTDIKAKVLYASLDADNLDEFKKLINQEENDNVLKLLYQMLTFESKILDQDDIDLNKVGANILGEELDNREIKRPKIVR